MVINRHLQLALEGLTLTLVVFECINLNMEGGDIDEV